MAKALLVTDVQNDFCPGGALAVPGGDEIIPALNRYIEIFLAKGLPVIFCRDWHPCTTTHFREQGGDWPVHCVENSAGAEFNPKLNLVSGGIIVSKGTDAKADGYSAFEAKDEQERNLSCLLAEMGVKELFVAGLATDFCIKHTVLDGLRQGLKVYLLEDAVKGIEPKGEAAAKEAMVAKGAVILTLDKLEE